MLLDAWRHIRYQPRPRIMEVGNAVEAKANLRVRRGFNGEMELTRGGGDVREVIVLTQTAGWVEVEPEDALAHRGGDFDALPRLWIGRHHGQCLGLSDPQVVVGRLGPEG